MLYYYPLCAALLFVLVGVKGQLVQNKAHWSVGLWLDIKACEVIVGDAVKTSHTLSGVGAVTKRQHWKQKERTVQINGQINISVLL